MAWPWVQQCVIQAWRLCWEKAWWLLQVAVSVVLVTTAVLLNVAWQRYRALDVGYDADRVVRARPDWEMRGTDAAGQWSLARRVAERVDRRQEVEGVAVWRTVIESYPPRPEWVR